MINKIATLLLVITISSCTQKSKDSTGQNAITNNVEKTLLSSGAPVNQINFIKRIDSNATNAIASNNEFDKKEKVKELYIDFRSFIKNNLKDKFSDWNARVLEIENGDAEHSGVLIYFYVSTSAVNALGQSVHFRSFVPSSSAELITTIRSLKVNGLVKISGNFEYSDPVMIKMQPTSGSTDIADIFNNPEFFVKIQDIKQIP